VTGLGVIPVRPEIAGTWPFQGFPPSVSLGGTTFVQATWAWPYSGVVAQYRANVPFNAAHLLVYANGTYVVRHLDEYNPDQGYPLEHAVKDAPFATQFVVSVIGLAVGYALGAWAAE